MHSNVVNTPFNTSYVNNYTEFIEKSDEYPTGFGTLVIWGFQVWFPTIKFLFLGFFKFSEGFHRNSPHLLPVHSKSMGERQLGYFQSVVLKFPFLIYRHVYLLCLGNVVVVPDGVCQSLYLLKFVLRIHLPYIWGVLGGFSEFIFNQFILEPTVFKEQVVKVHFNLLDKALDVLLLTLRPYGAVYGSANPNRVEVGIFL